MGTTSACWSARSPDVCSAGSAPGQRQGAQPGSSKHVSAHSSGGSYGMPCITQGRRVRACLACRVQPTPTPHSLPGVPSG